MDESGSYAPGARLWRAVRLVLKALWTAVALYAGFMGAGISSWFFSSNDYCTDDDPDPLLVCFPSWEENPLANVAIAAFGLAVFAVLTAPLWLGRIYRRAGSRTPEELPPQRP